MRRLGLDPQETCSVLGAVATTGPAANFIGSRRSLETGAQLPLSPLLNQPHRGLEFRRVFPEGVVLEAGV
jgi:hypothetical protein